MKFVDTQEIAKHLSTITSELKSLNVFLNSYDMTAESFGESTFRPEIEAQLRKMKQSYIDNMCPILEKMIADIEPVKTEYENRANQIAAAGQ